MKMSIVISRARLAGMTIAVALFAASSAFAVTVDKQPAKKESVKLVEQRIELPASNGMASSVTVWVPKTTGREITTTSPKATSAKIVELHAPNGPQSNITVWINN